jgi:hypothetical protein
VGIPYKVISAPSPEYRGDIYCELRTLYSGGYEVEANAARFLPRAVNEPQMRYQERLRSCGYINYLAEITDSFVSEVFTSPLALLPAADADDASTPGTLPSDEGYYRALQADADLTGTALSTCLQRQLTEALVLGRSYLLVDFPALDGQPVPATLLEEDALGASRAYCVQLPTDALISWRKDDHDAFIWAIVKKVVPVREGPFDPPGMIREEFKVWVREESGLVTWKVFATPPHPVSKPPKPNDDVPLVEEGTTSFDSIPVLELVVPPGLWVGNKIGPLVREHYQRRSALVSAQNKSLFALPVAYLGPEMSASGDALPAEVQQNPNRVGNGPAASMKASGFMVMGKDDKIAFEEPSGQSYEIVATQLKELVDEVHRTVSQMAASVSSTANAVGRSGDSKALDRASTEIVVDALAGLVKGYAKKVFDFVSRARGESIVWQAVGLDRTDYPDRAQLLQEALAVESIPIPSPTFIKTYKTKLALALIPKIDPMTSNVIRDEISDAIDAMPDPHPEPDGDEKPDDKDEKKPEDGNPKGKADVGGE